MSSITNPTLAKEVLRAFDDIDGFHAGHRAAHAKGILLAGVFTPSAEGAAFTRAPHLHRASTPVSVRFSNFSGLPAIPDNQTGAGPRGIAIRFHLADHVHTDIIGHSINSFPTRTAEEFLELLRAAYASGPDVPSPKPIEQFLGAHPAALRFFQTPKPIPASFTTESFFAVNAYRFTNSEGIQRYGRYRILPAAGNEYLDPDAAAAKGQDYLTEDLRERLAQGPISMNISVEVAAPGDIVDDATISWPADRPKIAFGALELTSIITNNDAEQRHIIFDPIPRVDGIDPSGDPLLEPRADIYLMSGRRRRAGVQQ